MRALILTLVLASSMQMCTKKQSDNDAQGCNPADVVEQISALRNSHRQSCASNNDCRIPYKCYEKRCEVPPAVCGDMRQAVHKVSFQNIGKEIYVETAHTVAEHALGLMFRRKMNENWGMIFVFDDDDFRRFWMRNVLIPLDMIFLSADGEIINIAENAKPLNDRILYESTGKARYVLELAGGSCKKFGIKPKDRVIMQDPAFTSK